MIAKEPDQLVDFFCSLHFFNLKPNEINENIKEYGFQSCFCLIVKNFKSCFTNCIQFTTEVFVYC